MPTLTPLDGIAGFDATMRSRLAEYWITTAEEFVSTARSSNEGFGSGLAALANILGLSDDSTRTLVSAAQAVLPAGVSFTVGPPPVLGTGAIFEDLDLVEAASFSVPVDLPTTVDLTDQLPAPQQQGQRDSCVAFALVALYQLAAADSTDLSEQFLYWACKQRDNHPGGGTKPPVAFEVLRDIGVCTEATWPYVADNQPGSEGQGPPPAEAESEARQRRIKSFQALPKQDIHQIRAALAEGNAVMIGMFIYEHWLDAWQGRSLGRIRKPLPGESRGGGHAMVAVGYREDLDAPGGGYVVVRNSWGTSWASDNSDGPGYCHIPYRLLHENNLVSMVIGELAPASETAAGQDTAGTAEPAASEPLDVQVQALITEAQAIRDQANSLAQRLAALHKRITGEP